METKFENISIGKLAEIENLTKPSHFVCRNHNLKDINSLMKYYWVHGDFIKLKGCGVKINHELVAICKTYEEYKEAILSLPDDPPVIPVNYIYIIDSLNTIQKKTLDILIQYKFEELSTRGANSIKCSFDCDIGIKGFRNFLDQKYKVTSFRNVGKKTAEELNNFLDIMKKHLEQMKICRDAL